MNRDEFCAHLKSVIKECYRILKIGGRVSIVLEAYLTLNSFFDFPGEAHKEFLQQGFRQIGKVYLANQTMRGGLSTAYMITESKRHNFMISDCRELLTFEK
jgi:ubiquinone/menaquinone biosynthesis C-methylase UbiE